MKYDADEFRECASRWINESKPENQLINEEYMALRLRVAVDEAERLRAEAMAFRERKDAIRKAIADLYRRYADEHENPPVDEVLAAFDREAKS